MNLSDEIRAWFAAHPGPHEAAAVVEALVGRGYDKGALRQMVSHLSARGLGLRRVFRGVYEHDPSWVRPARTNRSFVRASVVGRLDALERRIANLESRVLS